MCALFSLDSCYDYDIMFGNIPWEQKNAAKRSGWSNGWLGIECWSSGRRFATFYGMSKCWESINWQILDAGHK